MNDFNPRSKSGRPAGQDADRVRNLLLDAARQLFSVQEFKAVSVKRIANTAGVNGAMVHYYFGDKKGLYLAMVEKIFVPVLEGLSQLEHKHHQSIEDLVKLYTRLLAENPWWPNFLIREVIYGDEEFRSAILKKMSESLAPRIMAMIGEEVKDGHFRTDLNPEYAVLSLMGMMIFPFLSRTVAARAFGMSVDFGDVDGLASHTSKLFLYGAVNQTADHNDLTYDDIHENSNSSGTDAPDLTADDHD
jgi:TetR/AcrR family transcriptional regulator